MKIEWNKVTWYSKFLAIIVFIMTFFVGYAIGVLYQEAKDQSDRPVVILPASYALTSTPPSVGQGTSGTATGMTSTSTTYHGVQTCVSSKDCPVGFSCLRTGPIVEGLENPMKCVSNGTVIPL